MFTPANIAEHFPCARFEEEWSLVTWFPTGELTNERADRILEFLELAENREGPGFDRYTDMTGYSRIQITLDHVVRLARRRRCYKGPAVKSAFFAVRLITVSVASMYQELMEGSPIEVRTFRDRAAAAEWLGVPVTALDRSNPSAS